jgi:hypothetical protein
MWTVLSMTGAGDGDTIAHPLHRVKFDYWSSQVWITA